VRASPIPAELPHGSDITDGAWHDSYVPVVFLITIAAVLVGIFFAATGRGGELAYEHADHAPLDLGPVSAADIALLRPPTALWGYNMQVTDEALDHMARAMRERDVTIAYLQEQLAGYERHGSYTEPKGAHARQALDAPLAPAASLVPELVPFPAMTSTTEAPDAQDVPDAPQVPEAAEFPVFASGGLGSLNDLRALEDRGVAAAIIGMALYSGAMDPRVVAEEFAE